MKSIVKVVNAVVIAGGIFAASAANAGLVTNGGFESGDFSGWQLTGSADMNLVAAEPDYVHGGENVAFFGEFGGLGGIAQQVTTTVGATYALKFWLGNMGGSEANSDTVSFFSLVVGGAAQPTFLSNDKTATELTAYRAEFVATAGVTELAFLFRQDEAFWFLDDVSVDALSIIPTPPASVPEPGTIPLLLAAMAAWWLGRAKRTGKNGNAQ